MDEVDSDHCDDQDVLLETADLVEQIEEELAPSAPPDESDAEKRLAVDQLIVEAVLQQGLGGNRHQDLNAELIRYAVPVLKYLLQTGMIISKCKRLRREISDVDGLLELTAADRDDLAYEMVADGMLVFTRGVFEDRRWSPAGGASLKTYFVNACVMQFPSLYRKWWNHRRRVRPIGLLPDPDRHGGPIDPAVQVAAEDEASRVLKQIDDEKMRKVLSLRAIGFTATAAAKEAGLTPKAAESWMGRYRKNMPRGERTSQDGDVEGRGRRRFQ
ncbi:hypothetical protein [Actinoallomurus oryzae]|uniref:hypothetical protein n=1 Tax=Actinoallomurus oryzae TaxID=502180 RepID=UPI0031EA82F4